MDTDPADFILQIHYLTYSWKHCSMKHLMQDSFWTTCPGIINKCEQTYIIPASSLSPLIIWVTSAQSLGTRFSPPKSVLTKPYGLLCFDELQNKWKGRGFTAPHLSFVVFEIETCSLEFSNLKQMYEWTIWDNLVTF